MSPRPFERPATIHLPESAGLVPGASLDGLWLPARGDGEPRGGAVVAPPHPLMGGSMDSPVATEIALAASDAGRIALRFDWRGVGGSAGSPSGDAEDADTDYRAAIEFMEESVDGPIVACGYSWGALAAARVGLASPRVRALALVAPPASMLDLEALAAWGHPILVVVGDRDEYAPLAPLQGALEGVATAEVAVLEDVDHFFMSGLGELGSRIRSWLG
ncbi:MAG: alpha/beta hydrolase, partial [bacterium]